MTVKEFLIDNKPNKTYRVKWDNKPMGTYKLARGFEEYKALTLDFGDFEIEKIDDNIIYVKG